MRAALVSSGRLFTDGNPVPIGDSPTEGPPGITVRVDGTSNYFAWGDEGSVTVQGLEDGQAIGVGTFSVPSEITTATADESGDARVEFAVRAGMPGGAHQLVLFDLTTLARLWSAPIIIVPDLTCTAAGEDADIDGDAIADRCDPHRSDGPLADIDDDGVMNSSDNCPVTPNSNQAPGTDYAFGASCDPASGFDWPAAIRALNQAPSAEQDAYVAQSGRVLAVPPAGVLSNDVDPEGDGLYAELADPPTHGSVDFNPDGSFSYTPGPGFVGDDRFTYWALDGEGRGDLAEVGLTVEAAPAPCQSPSGLLSGALYRLGQQLGSLGSGIRQIALAICGLGL